MALFRTSARGVALPPSTAEPPIDTRQAVMAIEALLARSPSLKLDGLPPLPAEALRRMQAALAESDEQTLHHSRGIVAQFGARPPQLRNCSLGKAGTPT